MFYIEPDDGQFFNTGYIDEEKGGLKGGRGAVSFMGPGNLYLRASYGGVAGKVDYTGFQGVNPDHLTSRATMRDYDARLGVGVAAGKWMLTPYLTLGKDHWLREIGIRTKNGFNETFGFDRVGLGNMIQCSPWDGLVLTGDASLGRTVHAWIDVPAVGLNRAPLGSAPVVRLGLEGDCRVYKWFHVFLGGEYLHYAFGQSDVQKSGFFEPFSHTDLSSFTAGIRLSY